MSFLFLSFLFCIPKEKTKTIGSSGGKIKFYAIGYLNY